MPLQKAVLLEGVEGLKVVATLRVEDMPEAEGSIRPEAVSHQTMTVVDCLALAAEDTEELGAQDEIEVEVDLVLRVEKHLTFDLIGEGEANETCFRFACWENAHPDHRASSIFLCMIEDDCAEFVVVCVHFRFPFVLSSGTFPLRR